MENNTDNSADGSATIENADYNIEDLKIVGADNDKIISNQEEDSIDYNPGVRFKIDTSNKNIGYYQAMNELIASKSKKLAIERLMNQGASEKRAYELIDLAFDKIRSFNRWAGIKKIMWGVCGLVIGGIMAKLFGLVFYVLLPYCAFLVLIGILKACPPQKFTQPPYNTNSGYFPGESAW